MTVSPQRLRRCGELRDSVVWGGQLGGKLVAARYQHKVTLVPVTVEVTINMSALTKKYKLYFIFKTLFYFLL